jgi:hypothetical protein
MAFKFSNWIPVAFCAALSVITILRGRDVSGAIGTFVCFMPICFYFVCMEFAKFRTENRVLREMLVDLAKQIAEK